jgi:hypothetical protein
MGPFASHKRRDFRLVKPIRQAELLDAVCQALNKISVTKNRPLVTRHALQENKHRSRVLLAEDNAVNQTLAVRLAGQARLLSDRRC